MNFIIDRTMPEKMRNILKEYGSIFESTCVDTKDKAISTHPDLQIHFVTSNIAICAPEVSEYYRGILPDTITIKRGKSFIGRTYPSNCAYNVARVGNTVICNMRYTDEIILDYYKDAGYEIINVNQGYTKCNICPLSDSIFITEDKGIYNTTRHHGEITPYLITEGSVQLEGFEYGFIGGASGMCENKLFLCGRVTECIHETILNITEGTNIEIIELSDDRARDFGSIISF